MTNAPQTERNDAIRAAYADGEGYRTLALRYGISPQRVSQIVRPDRYRARDRARRDRLRAEAAGGEVT